MVQPPPEGPYLLNAYRTHVEELTASLLNDYVARLSQSPAPRAGKEINDPVWGTISLMPAEVVMLDSPLFQRLRRLRQLGVAHLVYPSAHHTRFEHCVGACHQIGAIIASVNAHAGEKLIDDDSLRVLRMAALSHDLGHGLMSHVSDNAVKRSSEVRLLHAAFRDEWPEVGDVQLSEIAAAFMVLSPTFAVLLERAFASEGKACPARAAKQIARMILGMPNSPGSPWLHELITGPFDADKLDYLPRDAMFCGVPQVTDIPRMIQKIRGAQRAKAELSSEVQEALPEDAPREVLLIGLAPSGAQALDEVALAKSLMIDKVYRHHKVRAAEAMIASVLAEWQPLLVDQTATLPLALTDDEFLALDREGLLRLVGERAQTAGPVELDARVRTGMDILQRFRDRRLFVRAYAFSSHLTQDSSGDDTGAVRQPKEAVARAFRNHDEARQKFASRVVELMEQMRALIPDNPPPAWDIPSSAAAYIWLDAPDNGLPGEEASKDPEHVYLIGEEGTIRKISHVDAQTRGWADAYVQTHDLGYVFAPSEVATYVFAASRIAAYELFRATTSDLAAYHAKQNVAALHRVEDALMKTDFYKEIPPTNRPQASVLRGTKASVQIAKAVDRFRGYQGPSQTHEDGELVETVLTPERVARWVRQFDGQFTDCALALVDSLALIGRQAINEAVDAFLSSDPGASFRDGVIVPIGQPKDGSSNVAYYARDVSQKWSMPVLALADALALERPLLMVDDFIGRGSSTISILQAYLGANETEHLGELRPDPLEIDRRDRLRKSRVALLYSAGMSWWSDAENSFADKLKALELSNVEIYVHIGQGELPMISTAAHPRVAEERWGLFIEHCRDIGNQLLKEQSEEKRSDRALGYGNRGLLIATPYNTPTASLTCLWAEGEVGGWSWEPLLPRLKKV